MTRLQIRVDGHDRTRSLGHFAAAWIEQHCRHGVGNIRGQSITLDDDFYGFIVDCYVLETSGARMYRTCVLSRPKGTAKSELAAWIVLFDSLAPSRFDHWAADGEVFECSSNGCMCGWSYDYLPGEPVGEPITDPIVKVLATEERQSNNTYRNVQSNLTDPDGLFKALSWIQAGITRALLGGSGEIRRATSSSNSADGGLETMAVVDESHVWTTAELKDLYDIVDQNLPKRSGWMLITTTMHRDGEGSINEGHFKLAKAIEEGKVGNTDKFLYDHLEGSEISDLANVEELLASLRVAYAERDWIPYDDRLSKASNPTYPPEKFRRYYLNQVAGSSESFVTSQQLAAIGHIDGVPIKPLARGDVITLGMDYAPGNRSASDTKRKLRIPDATALIACRLSDMSLHPIGIWEASERAAMDGWNPPMHEIEQAVHDTFKHYKVVAMWADPTGIEGYLDRWTSRYHKQLSVKASLNRPMYRYMSGKSATQSGRDVDGLYEAIATESVRIVESLQLTRHFLNARRAIGRYGTALFKKNPDSPDKIDGAVSSVLAHAAAVQALNKGIGTQSKRVGRVGLLN